MFSTANNIIQCLRNHAKDKPDATLYILMENGLEGNESVTFNDLYSRVRNLASVLVACKPSSKTALLVYKDVYEFIAAFLACQYTGLIPVPVYYSKGSRQVARLSGIMEDARSGLILTSGDILPSLRSSVMEQTAGRPPLFVSTDADAYPAPGLPPAEDEAETLAFIQYTSGSTGKPKGVVVTHENLMHNQRLIQETFGCSPESVIFSWLPFHHDMGLIGNILHSIYVGCTCIIMSPFNFMQRPQSWLEAISRFRVTHSGGPNFAYDLCVEKTAPEILNTLDLSCWKVAYNGSEPVKAETLLRFSGYFKTAGFSQNAFSPCYGLAEATLLVAASGREQNHVIIAIDKKSVNTGTIQLIDAGHPDAKMMVSSGAVANEMNVKVISAVELRDCKDLEEGEICIAGNSVTGGYWNKITGNLHVNAAGNNYLKTGDTGFIYQGQLFVHGRIKEMVIIRGRNYYPYDIEQVVAESDPSIEANGVAVFSYTHTEESFVVVAEVKRTSIRSLNETAVLASIEKDLAGFFGISPYDIILTTPLSIPRTTSGKLQRVRCADNYRMTGFPVLASKLDAMRNQPRPEKDENLLLEVRSNPSPGAVGKYLLNLIQVKTGIEAFPEADEGLSGAGLDSLRALELINTVNKELNINIDAAAVFQDNSMSGLINTIDNLLWLRNEETSGKEILI